MDGTIINGMFLQIRVIIKINRITAIETTIHTIPETFLNIQTMILGILHGQHVLGIHHGQYVLGIHHVMLG